MNPAEERLILAALLTHKAELGKHESITISEYRARKLAAEGRAVDRLIEKIEEGDFT